MNKTLATLLYEFIQEKYKDKKFTINDVWKQFAKKNKISSDALDCKSELYLDILQDKRFIYLNNNEWKLRESFNNDEIAKIESKVFFDADEDVVESNNKDTSSNAEIEIDDINNQFNDVSQEEDEDNSTIKNNSKISSDYEDEE